MTAILVEDMPQAIRVLENDLAEHCPEVSVIGTAQSIVQAAKLLTQVKPDLIFLDILLGDGTGFDLLEIFPALSSKVIFVTASDEYAIRAFRYAAVDYLLKPIEPAQLREAVSRAKTQITGSSESLRLLKDTIARPDVLPDRISLTSQERIRVVEIKHIVRCESDGNNTWFILAPSEKILVTRTLKGFEQLLERHNFIRVHQTHLVQLAHIQEYVKKDGGYLKMKNGDNVPVAVRKKAEIVEMLEAL
jgi:two-component system, LytTR family, response regulator